MPAGPGAPPAAGPGSGSGSGSGSAGAAVERLVAVLARLRSEDGCPWDRKQTWSSLRRFVLEEAHELAAAIDDGDPALVREECGDLLLQVAFLSGIAAETGEFGLTEVAEGITAKLVRRHPQVFGNGPRAADAEEALTTWEAVKAEEKRERGRLRGAGSPTLPPTLPALVAAAKVADLRRPTDGAEAGIAGAAEAALTALREAAAGRDRSPDGTAGEATGGKAGEATGGTAGEVTGGTAGEATDRATGEATDRAAGEASGRELAVAVGEALYAVAESAAAAGVDPEAALSAAVRRRLDPAPEGAEGPGPR